jgi:hypothetical protein
LAATIATAEIATTPQILRITIKRASLVRVSVSVDEEFEPFAISTRT